MTKTRFTLPKRVKTATGKLEILGTGEFAIRESSTGRLFVLANGDKVKSESFTATVNLAYYGKDKLNGNIGSLITLPERDEWGYARHLFFWRLPVEREALQPWLDAYVAQTPLTITFAARPLADPRNDGATFISGRLEAFHEQGMEGNIGWSLFDTQKHSYAALHMLEEGDKLTIFDKAGKKIVWQGTMTKRRKANLVKWCYERNKKPTKETEFLVKAFFQELPAVVEKAKPAKA